MSAAYTLDGEALDGTLDDFVAVNDLDAEEVEALRALRPGESYRGGGGGWGSWTVVRVAEEAS